MLASRGGCSSPKSHQNRRLSVEACPQVSLDGALAKGQASADSLRACRGIYLRDRSFREDAPMADTWNETFLRWCAPVASKRPFCQLERESEWNRSVLGQRERVVRLWDKFYLPHPKWGGTIQPAGGKYIVSTPAGIDSTKAANLVQKAEAFARGHHLRHWCGTFDGCPLIVPTHSFALPR